jgi:hypothetical protein
MWFYWFIFFGPISVLYIAVIIVSGIYLTMGIRQVLITGYKDTVSRKALLYSLLLVLILVGISSFVYFKWVWLW